MSIYLGHFFGANIHLRYQIWFLPNIVRVCWIVSACKKCTMYTPNAEQCLRRLCLVIYRCQTMQPWIIRNANLNANIIFNSCAESSCYLCTEHTLTIQVYRNSLLILKQNEILNTYGKWMLESFLCTSIVISVEKLNFINGFIEMQ